MMVPGDAKSFLCHTQIQLRLQCGRVEVVTILGQCPRKGGGIKKEIFQFQFGKFKTEGGSLDFSEMSEYKEKEQTHVLGFSNANKLFFNVCPGGFFLF